ncbi:MAG TPA: DUF6799 domain-containing protein [Hanamia sp.]|nr:DUF6799 domain-containing protein [Hanamia sp.]
MKNLFLLIVAFTISIGVSDQTMSDTSHSRTHPEYANKNHEMYFFKNGKMVMSKNGTKSEVNQAVTLANGTTLSTDGKVTWQDGKSKTLKDGEWVDMNGKIHSKKMKSSDSWKGKSDSSMKK